jgi:hypothetical protein
MEDTMLNKIRNFFSRNQGFIQASDFFEEKWYEECVAHAKTKLMLAEQNAKFSVKNTLHTWPEDDALEEAVLIAKEDLYAAEEDLRRLKFNSKITQQHKP